MNDQSSEKFAIYDLFAIGNLLTVVQNPTRFSIALVKSSLSDLSQRIERVPGLDASKRAVGDLVAEVGNDNEGTRVLSEQELQRVKSYACALASQITGEIENRQAIRLKVIRKQQALSPVIDAWPRDYIKPYHVALQEDLAALLATSQHRSAIVTGWMLGYDLLRSWVFEDQDRLLSFNELLEARTKGTKGGSRTICNYEDFFAEAEGFVLEICRDGKDGLSAFGRKPFEGLRSLLDKRNAFAHACYKTASAANTEAFLETLADTLTSAPFPTDVDAKRMGSPDS